MGQLACVQRWSAQLHVSVALSASVMASATKRVVHQVLFVADSLPVDTALRSLR